MKITKIFKILFLLTITLKGYSQSNFTPSQISNPNILPPDVSSFQKVNFLPVSNYTGRANIDIPFYQIDLGGLSIPIGLSYNTGGVKVNEVASSVGLNWSLNAGGVISKTVQDVDDFRKGYAASYDWENHMTYLTSPHGWLSYYTKHPAPNMVVVPGGDALPDEFKVSAPDMTFSYIHNRASHVSNYGVIPFSPVEGDGYNQNGQFISVSDTNPIDAKPFILDSDNSYEINETYGSIITGGWGTNAGMMNSSFYDSEHWVDGGFSAGEGVYGINSIKIKSIQGYEYTFDKIDASQYVYDRNPDNPNVTNTLATNLSIIVYHLSKITDLKTNKSVEFQYESYTQSFSEIIDNCIVNPVNALQKGLWIKYPKLNRLKKIIFDKGYIDFNYDLNRDDIIGEKALTSIVLFNIKNNQIKKMNLSFDYFQSTQSVNTAYSKRLRLKDVVLFGINSSSNQKYKLTYNNTPLPLRSLAVSDFFGYNNGEANKFSYDFNLKKYITQPPLNLTSPNPTLYFNPNKNQYSIFQTYFDANSIMMPGNYSLMPNLEYCKAGILEKIEYPTGGYIHLEYELNKFKLNGEEFQGGGLRIKEQKISDGINLRTLKFSYLGDDNKSSGTIVNLPKFSDFSYIGPKQYPLQNNLTQSQFNSWFRFEKYNSNKANIDLTSGSYIGYSNVKVYEENKGFTVYKYTSPTSHPNTNSTAFLSHVPVSVVFPCFENTNNYKKIYFDNGKFNLQIDNDVYRGKLLNESIYNQQGNKLKEIQYNFTEKKYKDFLLIINTLLPEEETCNYSTDSPQTSAQYGITGQRRYLLTSIVEKEYFGSSIITKTKSSEYDNNYSLIRKENVNDNLNTYRNEYYYPFDSTVQNEYGMSNLIQNNRKSERVLTYSFKNNEKLLEEKVVYNLTNNLILPKQIKKYKSSSLNNTNEINSLEVTLRDNVGNICELTDALGSKTSFIWGYNKTEIIAKIENTSYSSIQVNLVSDLQSTSDTGTESQLDVRFSNLRALLPNSLITTYSHKPLIGVSAITDAKGNKTTYEYDDFGRLKAIRDKNNNILSENEYHYKVQN